MKTALSLGANFWNSGEFYGSPEPTLNLQLLKRYFTKYPEDADKVVLSVKGGIDIKRLAPTGGAAAVKASVDNIIRHLGGTKTLDIFECARVDPNTPIEETIGALAECVKEGKIRAIGLSEASAATIRRAHAVHPIAGVELEVSLWSTEIFDNGIADTCKELGIPIVAYSPLGRGFLAVSSIHLLQTLFPDHELSPSPSDHRLRRGLANLVVTKKTGPAEVTQRPPRKRQPP